jgi:hypothetical protein
MEPTTETTVVIASHDQPAIFNETVYANGEIVVLFRAVIVSNRADEFIMRTRWSSLEMIDSTRSEEFDREKLLILNPDFPTRGKNVYTMDPLNFAQRVQVPFHRISVVGESLKERRSPIEIAEHSPGAVYDYNANLTKLEMAIMVKHHAIAHPGVQITLHLYHAIKERFDKDRRWFRLPSQGIVLTANYELQQDGQPLDVPLALCGNPISLH